MCMRIIEYSSPYILCLLTPTFSNMLIPLSSFQRASAVQLNFLFCFPPLSIPRVSRHPPSLFKIQIPSAHFNFVAGRIRFSRAHIFRLDPFDMWEWDVSDTVSSRRLTFTILLQASHALQTSVASADTRPQGKGALTHFDCPAITKSCNMTESDVAVNLSPRSSFRTSRPMGPRSRQPSSSLAPLSSDSSLSQSSDLAQSRSPTRTSYSTTLTAYNSSPGPSSPIASIGGSPPVIESKMLPVICDRTSQE
ncbi:hypothetical protein IW261DRAFT_409811 [Armillaria novae-zelandiae]|uniref:Uncharacterized protein n=1 Tax=Armillaria novae-zelandiae TaxID=153914 RepID=A0AA39PRS2_9AGAR|nr:hypothetical protein IW261DRAFT_409811 [Armillaria novae-zelandiae]